MKGSRKPTKFILVASLVATYIHALGSPHNTPAYSAMTNLSIAVHPPSRAQTTKPFYPPVIARRYAREDDGGCYFFAMAIVLDGAGNVLEGHLRGNTMITGVQQNDATSRSGYSTIFLFPDLALLYEGLYTIRLDTYTIAYENPEHMVLDAQIETGPVAVYKGNVTNRRPCE